MFFSCRFSKCTLAGAKLNGEQEILRLEGTSCALVIIVRSRISNLVGGPEHPSSMLNKTSRFGSPCLRALHISRCALNAHRSTSRTVVRHLRSQKFLGRDASRHSASALACAWSVARLLSPPTKFAASGWTIFDLSESLNPVPPTSACREFFLSSGDKPNEKCICYEINVIL